MNDSVISTQICPKNSFYSQNEQEQSPNLEVAPFKNQKCKFSSK